MTALPVYSDPVSVQAELKHIGLDRDKLINAIYIADGERALCTAHDPLGFDLVLMNAKMARALRDTFVDEEWVADEAVNQPGIRNPSLKVRVIPCNFDEHAGIQYVDPTNLRKKGSASRSKTACNGTAWFPGMEPKEVQQDDGYQTFVVGTHVDEAGVLRAEISKPTNFASGKYVAFSIRLILIDGNEENEKTLELPSQTGQTDLIDIQIKRK